VQVHLVDGTYELFRHHFGAAAARRKAEAGPPGDAAGASDPGGEGAPGPDGAAGSRAATRGVVASVLGMLADGATHLGVATDHVIESFRNGLWAGYKSSAGVPEELLAQFGPVEEALAALGVTVWPMVELEADDALASAAEVAGADPRVERVLICTPDKDLGQAVVGTRVVQLDRRADKVIDEAAVVERFGVGPASVPDWLALVGDSADGFPGIPGWGARTASAVLARYGHLEAVPDDVAAWDPALLKAVRGAAKVAANLAAARPAAELFKDLATLRVDASLVGKVDGWEWRGPSPGFEAVARELGAPGLAERAARLADQRAR
jgi:5'-3' exonuclease